MAKKITVAIIDDVDSESVAEESIEFSIDGITYEIDLSSRHASKLRSDLRVWVEHARRTSGRRRSATLTSSRKRSSGDQAQSALIRAWAIKNGTAISARGRIPAEIVDAFHAAN